MSKKINALIILDGFAFAEDKSVSAIDRAGTPYMDTLYQNYPNTQLGASGLSVGLPDGQMGNSEVGHLNIGAGRVVYQELTRITKSIEDGDFFANSALTGAAEHVKKTGGKLHFAGLLSDGGVHSHNTHLYALLELAKRSGLADAYIHCFLDGRDVSPVSGAGFVSQLYSTTKKMGMGSIASVCGRYYAMDRDNRWDRVKLAYDLMVNGIGEASSCPYESINKSYQEGVTDEFVKPISVHRDGQPVATVQDGDAVVFFNFRPDRAREITRAFTEEDFSGFDRGKRKDIKYVCLTQYDVTFKNVDIAYTPQSLDNTLGEYLSQKGYTQLRIAETEKYAHVTFFFNGGVEKPYSGEDRILVPSPKVATYDLQPEMSAYEVAAQAEQAVRSGKYDVMVLNFANCDMVGHTGVMQAAEKAVRAVDKCLQKVLTAIFECGGTALVTADHGNADKMLDAEGNVFTAHTTNPVPLILAGAKAQDYTLKSGKLCDIAPTLLYLMGEAVPAEMTGQILAVKNI